MYQASETPKWWRYLAKFLLIVTIGVVLLYFYGFWRIKNYVEPGEIILAFYLTYLIGASLGLALLALIGVVTGLFLKYTLRDYVVMAIISLAPLMLTDVFYTIILHMQ